MPKPLGSKRDRLRAAGLLHPHPERVRDPRFADSAFFDPHDIVQVRYEMVRLVRVDDCTFADAALRFGVSLPTCFRAARAFADHGLRGLLPRRRGPRGPHKITPEILAFVDAYRASHGPVSTTRLAPLIRQRFGLSVHPRGLDKALARRKKKLQPRRR